MKAEQRKELETNTLADRMGQAVQRVKTSPRRAFVIYSLALLFIVGGAWVAYRWMSTSAAARSEQWALLYDGEKSFIEGLTQDKDSNAGKAAFFQIGWNLYWNQGVKMLAVNREGGLQSIKQAGDLYQGLRDECKEDKVFEPQAMLGQAVVFETRSLQDNTFLDKAKDVYSEIVTKYEKSAEGKFAQDRLEILNDKSKRAELAATYGQLRTLLDIRVPLAPFGQQGGFDPFPPPKGNKK